jgi:chitin disaccharide deacetylase
MPELIINADDFGRSAGTNAGIIEAHEHGIVTSASLMVRWPAAELAAAYARAHPELSVGLHVDLTEWSYRESEWVLRYENAPPDEEIEAQLSRFRDLMGRDPTHVDSHQHVHREEPVASLCAALARQLDVPLRERSGITYCGSFYGQSGKGDAYPSGIAVELLVELIEKLPEGITEIGCHPGMDQELESGYRLERLKEVETLCDLRLREAVTQSGVNLRSFAGLRWRR